MSRRRIAQLVVLPPLAMALMGVDKGCVTSPTTDTIVISNSQTVKGDIAEYDATGTFVAIREGKARLKVGLAFTPWANTVDKVWTINPVTLSNGVNKISGQTQRMVGPSTINGTIPEFILEYKTDLSNRGTQKVFLDWTTAGTGIDDKLKAIATHTLEPDPTPAQLDTFVTDVKNGVRSFIQKAYTGISISFVDAAGTDVHTIRLRGEDTCSLYGSSPGDYKNTNKTQTSSIYIGTFKCVVVDNDSLLTETPAKTTDTIAQRVTDISTFIGRTAAHEMGHSLGVTDESNLHGCEGMHNCEAYDDANPSDRFNNGHYIMDPGGKSLLYARIGQGNATTRQTKRPVFNRYSKSYLNIIH
jgi:hypothetical protein